MAALRLAFAILLLGLPAAAHAGDVERWRAPIDEASARFGIPIEWIEKVMVQESGAKISLRGLPIVSPAGAMGLMQVMPATWADMRARLGLGADPHDPRDNVLAGSLYLRLMYDRFGYPGLFAAYNAGPARYAAHLRSGRPLPAETRAYVATLVPGAVAAGQGAATGRVVDRPGLARQLDQAGGRDPIFFVLRGAGAERTGGPVSDENR